MLITGLSAPRRRAALSFSMLKGSGGDLTILYCDRSWRRLWSTFQANRGGCDILCPPADVPKPYIALQWYRSTLRWQTNRFVAHYTVVLYHVCLSSGSFVRVIFVKQFDMSQQHGWWGAADKKGLGDNSGTCVCVCVCKIKLELELQDIYWIELETVKQSECLLFYLNSKFICYLMAILSIVCWSQLWFIFKRNSKFLMAILKTVSLM